MTVNALHSSYDLFNFHAVGQGSYALSITAASAGKDDVMYLAIRNVEGDQR